MQLKDIARQVTKQQFLDMLPEHLVEHARKETFYAQVAHVQVRNGIADPESLVVIPVSMDDLEHALTSSWADFYPVFYTLPTDAVEHVNGKRNLSMYLVTVASWMSLNHIYSITQENH